MAAPLSHHTIAQAVVDLALGDAARAGLAAGRLNELGETAWQAAAEIAVPWGILAAIEPHLRTAVLSDETRSQIRGLSSARVARTMLIVQRSVDTFELFDRAGLDVMAIKGIAVIAVLGRSMAARAPSDLDIVVRESDATAARAVLREAGFHEVEGSYDRYMFDMAHSRRLHNFSRTFVRDGFEVDLHFRFGPNPPAALDTSRLIDRAVRAPLSGRTVLACDPLDGLLISTHHALRGSFAPQNTVRDMLDLRAWWTSGNLAPRTQELCETAVGSGLATSLLALWSVLAAHDPDQPFAAAVAALAGALGPAGCREAAGLQRYIEDTLAHGMPTNFTLDAFAPRLIVRSLWAGLRRPKASAEDIAWAGRRPLAGRIARLLPRAWRVVRELPRVGRFAGYRAVTRAQSRYH